MPFGEVLNRLYADSLLPSGEDLDAMAEEERIKEATK
jgi:hypothetical protein